MKNQHEKIKGYRDLTQDEIDLMNQIKEKAAEVGELIEEIESDLNVDRRWSAIAKTELQQGFMALTRSIAKPESF
jgi:predicted site-specific integrase-resolvase